MKTQAPNQNLTSKILFIDDEAPILNALKRLVRRFGWDAEFFTDPQAALKALESGQFAVIVSDHRMPEMTGTQFLAKSRALAPQAIRILLTGYADVGAAIEAVNHSMIYRYLTKPWDEALLKTTLTEALEHVRLVSENARLQSELKALNAGLEKKVEERTAEVALLHQKAEAALMGTIKLLGTVAHPVTGQSRGHSKRVAKMSSDLAKKLECTPRERFEILVAGYLHDMGHNSETETNVPPRHHAEISADLIQMIPNLGKTSEYVRTHCEKVNGSGKPHRLKGEEIPLGGQILGLANDYDEYLNEPELGLTRSPRDAINHLSGQSGRSYDPRVLEALIEVLTETGSLDKPQIEVALASFELRFGMVLSRDVKSKTGQTVLGKDLTLTPEIISKVNDRNLRDQLPEDFYVYQKSIPTLKTKNSRRA